MATAPLTTSLVDMHDVAKVFAKFDTNGDGKISKAELSSVLQALGSNTSPAELDQMMAAMDVDGDGFINLEEFVAFHGAGNDTGDLKEAFKMYDKDGDGKITAKELHAVLSSLGETCLLKDCVKMIAAVDVDGDGCVDFNEFKQMMIKKN